MSTTLSRPINQSNNQALGRHITIQRTTLSGFRHHDAPRLWLALQPGALLTLQRERDNPHDEDAVALHWRGHKLGYLPQRENLVAARLLDKARSLSARIIRLAPDAERNARIGIKVLMH
ncbi:MAG: HIRAN domain-containing protein [Thiohalocapsa sp.]